MIRWVCVALRCVIYCTFDQKERREDDERVRISGKMNKPLAFALIGYIFSRSTFSYLTLTRHGDSHWPLHETLLLSFAFMIQQSRATGE